MATNYKTPFPRHYGSSLGHRQVVASSTPLIPVRTSGCEDKKKNKRNLMKVKKKIRKDKNRTLSLSWYT